MEDERLHRIHNTDNNGYVFVPHIMELTVGSGQVTGHLTLVFILYIRGFGTFYRLNPWF